MGAKHKSTDKRIGAVPTPSPLARGLAPTMEERIAMERRKVAYGKKFSLELAPMPASIRFNLMHETDASMDAVLSNGKCCNVLCARVQHSILRLETIPVGWHAMTASYPLHAWQVTHAALMLPWLVFAGC